MKEFILGGCIAFWIISFTLSSMDPRFGYISIIFPLLIAGVSYNIYLVKQIWRKHQSN